MRKLNNNQNKVNVTKFYDLKLSKHFTFIGFLLNYLNRNFVSIYYNLLIKHKYETWSLNILFFPDIKTLLKYKSIFFKRMKSLIQNKLSYTWICVVPNELNFHHYLIIYIRKIYMYFFQYFFIGFIKLLLLWSFSQNQFLIKFSYMLTDICDIIIVYCLDLLLYLIG